MNRGLVAWSALMVGLAVDAGAQSLGMAPDATDGVTAVSPLQVEMHRAHRDRAWDAVAHGGPLLPIPRGTLGEAEQQLFERLRARDAGGAIQHLQKHNPRVDLSDEHHHTALTLAVPLGDVGLVRELLRRGASPDEAGWRGFTPLGLAAYLGHDVSVRELLRRGADPLVRSQGGQTALHLAMAGGQTGSARLLLDALPLDQWMSAYNAAGRHPLAEAAFFGRQEAVRDMLARGASPGAPDRHGLDALHAAALGRQILVAEHLMAAGLMPRQPLTALLLSRMYQPLDEMAAP